MKLAVSEKAVFFTIFGSCIGMVLAGGIAQLAGQEDLVSLFGGMAIGLMGAVFLGGTILSAACAGEAWFIGIGRVTKQSHPFAYWATLSLPMALGVGLCLTGGWILIRWVVD